MPPGSASRCTATTTAARRRSRSSRAPARTYVRAGARDDLDLRRAAVVVAVQRDAEPGGIEAIGEVLGGGGVAVGAHRVEADERACDVVKRGGHRRVARPARRPSA